MKNLTAKILSSLFALSVAATALFAVETKNATESKSASATPVYDKVMTELGTLPHRVPGTPEYYQAIDKMEAILKENGVDVKRQEYPTLVPTVTKKEFTVDGKDLKDIIHPLAPNNAALMTTGSKPIIREMVYIPSSKLHKGSGQVEYGSIVDKIVLMDWGENYYPRIFFTENAKAIIFIGDPNTKQWDVAKLISQYSVAFPYFYISNEDAVKYGLKDEKKVHSVKMQINTRWDEVKGVNLWAQFNATDDLFNGKNNPEALVLGARLDTFGVVPGKIQGNRQTSNLALFAQTIANLNVKKDTLKRSIFLVLYGSAFNTYDSLRYFYYPIFIRNAQKAPFVQDYANGFREELSDNEKKIDVLNSHTIIIPEKLETSGSDYLKYILNILFVLTLAGGFCLFAVDIKQKQVKKRGGIGIAVMLLSAGALFAVYFAMKVAPASENEEKLVAIQDLESKITGMETVLGKDIPGAYAEKDGKLTAQQKEYISLLKQMDELTAGQEDELHYQVRILLRDEVISKCDKQNYELADINLNIRHIKQALRDLAALSDKDITDPAQFRETLRLRMIDDAISRCNALKFDITSVNLRDNEHRKMVYDNLKSPELKKELEDRLAKLEADKKQLEKEKIIVTDMRKHLNERNVRKYEDKVNLKPFIAIVKNNLTKRLTEIKNNITVGDSWVEIANATKRYDIVGAFFYDFSNDNEPIAFMPRGYEGVHSYDSLAFSDYSRYLTVLAKELEGTDIQKSKTPVFYNKNAGDPTTLNCLSLLYLPSSVSVSLKVNAFTWRNIPGDYDYDEIPSDRTYELRGICPTVESLVSMLATNEAFSMASQFKDPATFDSLINYYYKNGTTYGKKFSYLSEDGKSISGPAADALCCVRPNEYDRIYSCCGFSLTAFGKINQMGYVSMPFVTNSKSGGWWSGMNIMGDGLAFNEYGQIDHISVGHSDYFKLFKCYGGPHVYAYAPLTSNFCGGLSLVNGFTDGAFKNFRTNARVATGEGYAYGDKDMKAKIYFFNETFMLGSTPEDPIGKGISIKPEALLNLNASKIAIGDTIILNKGRIEKLHKRNIFNNVIETYEDKAEQHQKEAEIARKAGDINLARAHEVFGQTIAVQAYRPLRDMINDLVRSVLILLILTIPFAFSLERLVIGATNIYKQMGWVLVFFIGTFLLLYFTHPAFALSQAPLIIFIAFFIIAMSVVVIYIVMNRFKSELLAMQGMDTSAHRVNSENSMLLAAILIGVSSMRNRPVKTLLTILTVTLLTFTIISFASFESTEYVRPVYMGDGSGETRIESFLPQHVDLLMPTCQAVKDLYVKNYDVYYRSVSYNNPFYTATTYASQDNTIYKDILDKSVENPVIKLEAIVGFELDERRHSAKLAKLMPEPAEGVVTEANKQYPGVYLSKKTAESLNLKPGDVFNLRSIKVRLNGVFNAADMDNFTYLDSGKTVPPNFEETAKAEETGKFNIFRNADLDSSNFIWSNPDLTMLTDYETANRINGFINALVLYPKVGVETDIKQDANDIAEVTYGIVYSNSQEGVYRHFKAPVFSASGVKNLIVPLLLGALIILSSLLGSIADREREIFTFSALGLSPKDVSVLFFAESGVYAVIGGLGGYLLSQLTNSILTTLAKHGLMEAPEMNFSSMTTVYTILIVMAIVILSTVYPAIKAGRAASPDVARKWKMPPPDGDNLCFQFPFTVSRIDFGGILVFISEHFANHADSSLGSFAASNVQITHGTTNLTPGYMLSVDLTLAPFDLGVAEQLMMYSAPSDIEGVDVVTVNIIRKDGTKGAWIRGNMRFVGEVRNQFLLWRSLPIETVMHYRELAKQKLTMENEKEGEI